MKSFNNEQKLKDELLAEVIKHREADEIVQGTYGEFKNGKFKGCAVGCAIHSLNVLKKGNWNTNDHSVYEKELGIPRVLARLEDRIFEGLPVEISKTFPERFISSINVGANLEMVWPKLIVWMLGNKETGMITYAKKKNSIKAIQDVLDLFTRRVAGENISTTQWKEVRDNAYAAYAADAYAAYAADADAADAAAAYAADAYAAYAAYAYAADAYAAYAAYAADAYAAYAAYAADAYAAYAVADARSTSREKYYILISEKLLEIIRETK